MAGLLEKIRVWIDGDDALENIVVVDRIKSKSQDLLHRVLAAISNVIQEEIIQLPSGKVYVPSGFVIYLNSTDDKGLRKDKREFFESALSELVLEKIREVIGQGELITQDISFSLKVNGKLKNGEIFVEAISDETDKTEEISAKQSINEENLSEIERKFQTELGKKFNDIITPQLPLADDFTLPEDYTIPDNSSANILYRIEVVKNEQIIETMPVIKSEILVGRDSSTCKANIRLKSDNRHISSSHIMLIYHGKDDFSVQSFTGNQTLVDGELLTKDAVMKISEKSEIKIYEFVLRFRF